MLERRLQDPGPRVVDEDVNQAPRRARLRERRTERGAVGDIPDDGRDRTASRLDGGPEVVEPVDTSGDGDDVGATTGEHLGKMSTQTARRSRHHYDLPGKLSARGENAVTITDSGAHPYRPSNRGARFSANARSPSA